MVGRANGAGVGSGSMSPRRGGDEGAGVAPIIGAGVGEGVAKYFSQPERPFIVGEVAKNHRARAVDKQKREREWLSK